MLGPSIENLLLLCFAVMFFSVIGLCALLDRFGGRLFGSKKQ